MRSGALTERIEVYEPIIIKSDTGTETTTYQMKFTCRSTVKSETGTRENLNGDIAYLHNITFFIRRFYDFDEHCRVKWDGKFYRIISIDKNKERQYISVLTEEINE